MKLKFTLLTGLLFLLFGGAAMAQLQYRSNGSGGGPWESNTTWQTFNTGTMLWDPAVSTPTASDFTDIRNGDNVTLNTTLTIDQVVVDAGGTMTIQGGNTNPVTLNNLPATKAIDNSGQVTIQGATTLLGTGTLLNEAGSTLTVQGSSVLAVNTTNGGTVVFSGTSGVQTNTLTNNSVVNWTDNPFFLLSGGTVLNNDVMNISVNGAANIFGSGVFTNSSGAVINATLAATVITAGATITFTNSGSLEGLGTFDLFETAGSSGSVIPGSPSAAVLTVGQGFASSGTPNYHVSLYTAGGVAGSNYSQVSVAHGQLGAAMISFGSSSLTITDNINSGDANGTTYTVLTAPDGTTFNTGVPFASTSIPATLSTPTINSTSVTVTRISSLPLTWGPFTVVAEGNSAALAWSTLQESNVKDFTIERSSDAVTFTAIGTVKANGNTHSPSSYSFTDASPSMQGYNYYRLAETDLDGKKAYSVIDVLSFGKEKTVLVQTSPNPVRDMLNITVQADNLSMFINSMNGTTMKTIKLVRGFQQSSLSDLPAGAYNVIIYQGNNKVDSRQIVKF